MVTRVSTIVFFLSFAAMYITPLAFYVELLAALVAGIAMIAGK